VLWFWFLVGPALILTLASVAAERGRTAYWGSRLAAESHYLPPATVIVPVKGHDEGLGENLAALASLDYPDYELLVVAHSAADIPPGVLPWRARIVLAHGNNPSAGEKVQNLMAAVHAARKQSRILVFADSDGRVTKRWLRALAAPLVDVTVGAATGFRWFTPQPANLPSMLRAVWDAVGGGMLGPGDNRFAWGGAMAIRKETFFEAGVPEYWKNTVSDDYALSDAVHEAGLTIAYAPGALVPSHERISARELFSWTRRQMTITRVYAGGLWLRGLAAHIFYCGAMAASIAAGLGAHPIGWWTLGAQLIPGMWKGARRAVRARLALPECAGWFRRYGWLHALLVPLASWLWLAALAGVAFTNTIEWRGYRYDLKKPAVAERV
jgi:ceramide glucosyltransferase